MQQLAPWVRDETRAVFERAFIHSEAVLSRSRAHLRHLLGVHVLDPRKVCFVAAGSMGRCEALEASDLDLIAIVDDERTRDRFVNGGLYEVLRRSLSIELGGMDVSTGRTIMGTVCLSELKDPSKIGGNDDDRIALTRRTLVLTEAAEAGGELGLRSIRREILKAYVTRTDHAHPLALCNDVARYYRQVCIDYKAKHGTQDVDWAESNIKLRHARKLWYFSTALAIAAVATKTRSQPSDLLDSLLVVLDLPPCLRLIGASSPGESLAGEVLDHYATYLHHMSDGNARERLRSISHDQRYDDLGYASLKENSKALHAAMLRLLGAVAPEVKGKIFDWFLF
jgi:hypothetical protein